VLRRIFGSKREKVVGGWKRLHDVELHNLFALPNISRVICLIKHHTMKIYEGVEV
jgi:hypothetical protein